MESMDQFENTAAVGKSWADEKLRQTVLTLMSAIVRNLDLNNKRKNGQWQKKFGI